MNRRKGLIKAVTFALGAVLVFGALPVDTLTATSNSLPSAGIDFFLSSDPVSVKEIKDEKTATSKKKTGSSTSTDTSATSGKKTGAVSASASPKPTAVSTSIADADNTAENIGTSVTEATGNNENAVDSPASATDTAEATASPTAMPSSSVSGNNINETDENGEIIVQENITPVSDKTLKETERALDAKAEEESFKNLVIAKCDGWVNVRKEPNEEAEKVGKLYDKSVGDWIETSEDGEWYKISSGSVVGYVKGEYCVTGDDAVSLAKEVGTRMALVESDNGMFVREEPSLDANIMTTVSNGEALVVLEELDGWAKVDVEEGNYYVSLDFVKLYTEFVHGKSKEEEEAERAKAEREAAAARAAAAAVSSRNNSGKGKYNTSNEVVYAVGGTELGREVANYALQFKGNPYVYGGSDPVHGADCSGFVMAVYKHFGVSLPHSANADRKMGYAVDGLANAQPGDLVCYSGHVGMYIGNGQIIHASSRKTGIKISDADYKSILAIRRIF